MRPEMLARYLGGRLAWRKCYSRYGTILVDLKRRKVADLLPECSARAVEQWLKQHPGVKIISRDRQGALAYGGRRSKKIVSPQLKAVAADRNDCALVVEQDQRWIRGDVEFLLH
jgi:hypothetical protein